MENKLAHPLLKATNITASTDGVTLVDRASLSIECGEAIALLGPNGAGKTSLLRALLGQIPTSGQVLISGEPIEQLTTQQRALRVSYLPQIKEAAWPNTVIDVVSLGRFAHGVSMGRLSGADRFEVAKALEACQLDHIKNRSIDTLSGGEAARVHCARVFAANAPLMIADEPTAGLDPHQQHNIVGLLRQYANAKRAALLVLHDVNLALRYATRIIWMRNHQIVADLTPQETSADLVSDVYQVEAEVISKGDESIKQVLVAAKK